MQITNEMVEAAWKEYIQKRHVTNSQAMRAALEAALGAMSKCDGELVSTLRKWSEAVQTDTVSKMTFCDASLINGECISESLVRAAACIEDLAAALKVFAEQANTHSEKIPDNMFIDDYERLPGDTWVSFAGLHVGDLRRARAALERWGLK